MTMWKTSISATALTCWKCKHVCQEVLSRQTSECHVTMANKRSTSKDLKKNPIMTIAVETAAGGRYINFKDS